MEHTEWRQGVRINKYKILIILVSLLLFHRLSILFLSIDAIFQPEELYRGMISKELITGSTFSLLDYQCTGGYLVAGMLGVPFFLLFGDNLISLKLVALLFSLGTMSITYLFLTKHFNHRVAIITSLLFILSPLTFTKISLVTFGSHVETNFFIMVVCFIFYEIFFSRKQYRFYFVLLGLISGFAIFFSYHFLIFFGCYMLFWFALDKRLFLKKYFLIFFIPFFIFGLSPWIYHNLTDNPLGTGIGGKPLCAHFFQNDLRGVLYKFISLVTVYIKDSFFLDDVYFLRSNILSVFYYVIFISSFLALLWLNRKSMKRLALGIIHLKGFKIPSGELSKECFFLIYPIFFSIIYSLSDFKIHKPYYFEYRHLMTLYLFIFITLSLFLDKLKKKTTCLYNTFLIILLSLGIIGNLNLFSFKEFGKGITMRGFDYMSLGMMIYRYSKGDIDKAIDIIEKKVEKEYKYSTYQGLGREIRKNYPENTDEGVDTIERRAGEEYKRYFFRGLDGE